MIRKFRMQVGVSLDGPPPLQESLRGQAAATLRGLRLLEAEEIPFRVTAVVSDENVLQLDKLAWLLAAFRQAMGIGLDLLVVKGQASAAGAPGPAEASRPWRGRLRQSTDGDTGRYACGNGI
ncbi:MAG: hypothetical protein LBU39_09565 [Desulfobulbaceae bacterium]|nr:hypothetical protein [Desulfobulbaceae bacterium]